MLHVDRHAYTLRRLAGLCTVLLALVPATASAAVPRWELDRATAIAQIVWHPACGQLHVAFVKPDTDTPDDAGAWTDRGSCEISLAADRDDLWAHFETLCDVILHEAGHAAGRGHSSNPHSVMYPWSAPIHSWGTANGKPYDEWLGVDHRCLRRGRPYLLEHAALAR